MLGDRTRPVTMAGHKSIHGGGESVGERAVGDKGEDDVAISIDATREVREVHTVNAERFLAVATPCRLT